MSLDPLDYVDQLHGVVDSLTAPLAARHAARLQCAPGCAACCQDGLTVLPVEAALIARHHADVLDTPPPPPGACAFLDDQRRCRVYAHRPYICRTQGLPLRWVETKGRRVVERRDICPLNLPDPPGEPSLTAMPAADCWAIGPVEERLVAAQARMEGEGVENTRPRVALRELFRYTPPSL